MDSKHKKAKTSSSMSYKDVNEFVDKCNHDYSLNSTDNKGILMFNDATKTLFQEWQEIDSTNSIMHNQICQLDTHVNALLSDNSKVENCLPQCQNELEALFNTVRDQNDKLTKWVKKFEVVRPAMKYGGCTAAGLGKVFETTDDHRFLSGNSYNMPIRNNNGLPHFLMPMFAKTKENNGSETCSDIDYDKKGESLDDIYEHTLFHRDSMRRSASVARDGKYLGRGFPDIVEPLAKKPRISRDKLTAQTTVKPDMNGQTNTTSTVRIYGNLNRLSSESNLCAQNRSIVPCSGATALSLTELRCPIQHAVNRAMDKPCEVVGGHIKVDFEVSQK